LAAEHALPALTATGATEEVVLEGLQVEGG